MSEARHLVFYDGECGLCDHLVQWILHVDRRRVFIFAPLQGITAKDLLKGLPKQVQQADSLILVENYRLPEKQVYLYGKGAFRIAWLLGGAWKAIGWLAFLPPILYNWGYYLIARNRRRLFPSDVCRLPITQEKDRFLP